MKKEVKIIRVFEDGSKVFIEGKELENFNENQNIASCHCHTHGIKFNLVKWKQDNTK